MISPMSDAPPYVGPERRRALWVDWLLAALLISLLATAASICPLGWRPHLWRDPDLERFWAFLVLGLTAKLAAPRRHLSILACVVLMAVGTEAAQLLVASRHARVSDGIVKAVGAVSGVHIGYAFFKLRRVWKTFVADRPQSVGVEERLTARVD